MEIDRVNLFFFAVLLSLCYTVMAKVKVGKRKAKKLLTM